MSKHEHKWYDNEYTDYEDAMLRIVHQCACGELAYGPTDWCKQTRGHDHYLSTTALAKKQARAGKVA